MVDDKEEGNKALQKIGTMITIPFVLAVPPIIGNYIGRWIDEYFNTDPLFMLLMIVLGLFAGFRETYRIIQRFRNE